MTACECGLPHVLKNGKPSCSAHSLGRLRPEIAGKPCRQAPINGGAVCKVHGGSSRHVKAKAEKRVVEAEAGRHLETLAWSLGEYVPDSDPGEVILEQIGWRVGHVRWLRARAQAVDPDALTWGRTKDKVGGQDGGVTFEAKPNAWVVLYFEQARELERLCVEAVRCGLEERRVRLAEQQADQWVRLIDGVLSELGHDPDDPRTARVVERHLRLVAG